MLDIGERPRRPNRDPRVTGRVGRRTPAAPTNAENTATVTADETAATAGTETAVGATTAAAAGEEGSAADTFPWKPPPAVISGSGWVLAAKVDSSIRGGCQVGHEYSFTDCRYLFTCQTMTMRRGQTENTCIYAMVTLSKLFHISIREKTSPFFRRRREEDPRGEAEETDVGRGCVKEQGSRGGGHEEAAQDGGERAAEGGEPSDAEAGEVGGARGKEAEEAAPEERGDGGGGGRGRGGGRGGTN